MGQSRVSQYVEQRVMKERSAENRRTEIGQQFFLEGISALHVESERRAEGLRRQREAACEARELSVGAQRAEEEQDRERKRATAEAEEKIADELQRRKAVASREEARRRQIVEGSEELRALKQKLQAAAMNKGRAVQLLDQQAREQQERKLQAELDEQQEIHRLEGLEKQARAGDQMTQKRVEVKEAQQAQIVGREQSRLEQEAQHAQDRADVERLVAKVVEEDRAEAALRQQRREEGRQMMHDALEERRVRQEVVAERDAVEQADIDAFRQRKSGFEADLAADRARRVAEKERQVQALREQAEQRQQEADAQRQAIDDLWHEERLEAQRLEDERDARRRAEERERMLRSHQEQLRAKEARRQQDLEEEKQLQAKLMAKLAEDDKIEQMSDQKRRMRLLEHSRQVEAQLKARREALEDARRQEEEDRAKHAAAEAERQRIVDEERERLLAEFAPPLRGFWPKGVLQKESDARLLEDVGGGAPRGAIADDSAPGGESAPAR